MFVCGLLMWSRESGAGLPGGAETGRQDSDLWCSRSGPLPHRALPRHTNRSVPPSSRQGGQQLCGGAAGGLGQSGRNL